VFDFKSEARVGVTMAHAIIDPFVMHSIVTRQGMLQSNDWCTSFMIDLRETFYLLHDLRFYGRKVPSKVYSGSKI